MKEWLKLNMLSLNANKTGDETQSDQDLGACHLDHCQEICPYGRTTANDRRQ
jgi:hypothetical protein